MVRQVPDQAGKGCLQEFRGRGCTRQTAGTADVAMGEYDMAGESESCFMDGGREEPLQSFCG